MRLFLSKVRFKLGLLAVLYCFWEPSVAQSTDGPVIRVGIMTDCQYCNCNATGLRKYGESLRKLDSAAIVMKEFNPDLMFHLGDLIDHGFENYDSVLPRLEQFPVKVNLVPGNHDFMVSKELKQEVFSKTGMSKRGFSIISGDWQFVVLNGSDLSYLAEQTKEEKKARNEMISDLIQRFRCNEMPWNGGIGKDQMKWFEHELAAADSAGRKVIILCHFPVWPRTCFTLWNDDQVLGAISRHQSVKAYFCGHYHEGNYAVREGVHFVNFKGMVDTHINAFATVTLRNDRIIINGYGREPDRDLPIR